MKNRRSPKPTASGPVVAPNGTGDSTSRWRVASELFPPLQTCPAFAHLPEALKLVRPLSSKHRKSLPGDIAELSRILTSQRGRLAVPYWRKPNFVSAYLYYFLPWNLIRLLRLLAALPLPEPQADSWLLDAGSGPLTLPLALWLAKTSWRTIPLKILALDAARQPLQLGVELFAALAELVGEPSWQISIVTDSLQSLPRHLPPGTTPWLITAANTLNEMREQTARHGAKLSDREWRDYRLHSMLEAWASIWHVAPLLFVEPGTRLGGKTIEQLREVAVGLNLAAAAPCTHSGPCPLLEDRSRWCHFVFSAQDAPEWLKELSRSAGLFKTSLSLSPLFLTSNNTARAPDYLPIRVLSQPFQVGVGSARYGCAACGLCLMPDSERMPSGSLCKGMATNERDAHSGAVVVRPWSK